MIGVRPAGIHSETLHLFVQTLSCEPQLFGSAANNGRMLGEMDGQHAIVQSINEMAHVLTGRAESRQRKKSGLEGILERLKIKR